MAVNGNGDDKNGVIKKNTNTVKPIKKKTQGTNGALTSKGNQIVS